MVYINLFLFQRGGRVYFTHYSETLAVGQQIEPQCLGRC